jgi:hypothetical protein
LKKFESSKKSYDERSTQLGVIRKKPKDAELMYVDIEMMRGREEGLDHRNPLDLLNHLGFHEYHGFLEWLRST